MGNRTRLTSSQKREPELQKDGEHGAEAAPLKLRELTKNMAPLLQAAGPTQLQKAGVFIPSPHSQLVPNSGASRRWVGVTAL